MPYSVLFGPKGQRNRDNTAIFSYYIEKRHEYSVYSVVKIFFWEIRMADTYSFDVVSEVDLQEADNAVNQAMKEIGQRYDFKGSISKITLNKTTKELEIVSDDESRLRAVVDVLKGKFVKRNISVKALDFQKVEAAFSGTVNQKVKVVSGMPMDVCKDIVKRVKDSKLKVQVAIVDEKVRVSGKAKDDLQAVMQMLRAIQDIKVPLQFNNYR
jgi:cyclic-di-GMP-binding protein